MTLTTQSIRSLMIAGLLFSGSSFAYAAENSIHGNWITERIQGHKVKSDIQSTLDIADNGNISGTGGCNRYMGNMLIEDKKIKLSPVGGTMMACPPAQMQQDDKFHKALSKVESWEIRKDRLILIDAKNREVLRLARGKTK